MSNKSVKYLLSLSIIDVMTLGVLLLLVGCGEPMQFENAGSKHALLEDQQACDLELQTPAAEQYLKEGKGQLDPWQICMERKGWKRVDRPLSQGPAKS